MKKTLIFLLVLCMATMVFSGCEKSAEDESNRSEAPINSSTEINLGGSYTMATGGTSGTFYPYGGALCQIINKEIGTNITANSTGGGRENMALLATNETDFALLDADMMSYALTGTETFEGEKVDSFGSVASLFPQIIQIVVAADSDITSVADLKGKKVSVGDPGSGTSVNAAQILDAYDITFDDIQVNYLSFKESASAFQANSISAFIGVAGIPTSAVTEVSLMKDIRLISIDDEHMKILTERYAFFAPYTVEKDIYNTSENTETLAVMATLGALKTVDENVVYHFTRAMFENLDDLAMAHAKGKELSLEKALDGIDPQYLHPGAAKYYKEIGLLK